MTDFDQPYSREGYELMGAAFEVHNIQGGGLLEAIYQQSFELELKQRGIPFSSQKELTVLYKGCELEKKYYPDLHLFDKIIVEIKAVAALLPEHEAQLMNYMRITQQPVGYLINFGPIGTLQYKRFLLSEYL